VIPLLARPLASSPPPLTPDGDQAREWARRELSDPAYAAAQPTPLDRAARAVEEFIAQLFSGHVSGAAGAWIAVGAAVLVVALLIAGIIVWGRPRAVRRASSDAGELFGETETRSATQLRQAAEARAAASDWDGAIVLRFRALARGLAERGLVEVPPGATVHAFSRAASGELPSIGDSVEAAASVFDDVRYLRRAGTPDGYRTVAAADAAAMSAHPEPVHAGAGA
jgi:hypothetical protein